VKFTSTRIPPTDTGRHCKKAGKKGFSATLFIASDINKLSCYSNPNLGIFNYIVP